MHLHKPIFEEFNRIWSEKKAEVDKQLTGKPALRAVVNFVGGGAMAAGLPIASLLTPATGLIDTVRDVAHDPKGAAKEVGFRSLGLLALGGLAMGAAPFFGAQIASVGALAGMSMGAAAGVFATGVLASPYVKNVGEGAKNLSHGIGAWFATRLGKAVAKLPRDSDPANPAFNQGSPYGTGEVQPSQRPQGYPPVYKEFNGDEAAVYPYENYAHVASQVSNLASQVDTLTRQLAQFEQLLAGAGRGPAGEPREGTPIPRPTRRQRIASKPAAAKADATEKDATKKKDVPKKGVRVPPSAANTQAEVSARRRPSPSAKKAAEAPARRGRAVDAAPQPVTPARAGQEQIRVVRTTGDRRGPPSSDARPGGRQLNTSYAAMANIPDPSGRIEPSLGFVPTLDQRADGRIDQSFDGGANDRATRWAALSPDAPIVPQSRRVVPADHGEDVYVEDQGLEPSFGPAGFAPAADVGARPMSTPIPNDVPGSTLKIVQV